MHSLQSKFTRGAAAVAGLGLAAGLVAAGPAAQAATSTIQVRPADLIAPTDTSGGGVMEFLAQGVHLKTPDGADSTWVRAHFKVGIALDQVHAVDYTWYGTEKAPGVYYDIDLNSDGKPDGQLIGELTNGTKDLWLNRDAEDLGSTAVPAGFFVGRAPCSTGGPQNGNQDGCGFATGKPSAHGSIDDWVRSLKAAGKTPQLLSGGFVLNGASKGDGVLTQVTYGPNQYVFTNQAKAKVTVTAEVAHEKVKKAQKIRFSGKVEPAAAGAKVTLEVKKGGKWTAVKSRDVAASGVFRFGATPERLGKVRYRVTVTETNATVAAKSHTVKVLVTRR